MLSFIRIKVIVGIFTLFFLLSISTNAQEYIRTVDVETYDKTIDILFPLNLPQKSFEYGYLLRVKPSFDAEFLMEIFANEGKITITKLESQNGNLFSYFSDILEKEEIEDPEKFAQKVKIKKEIKVFSEAKFTGLRNQFAQKLFLATSRNNFSGKNIKPKNDVNQSETIIIDGTNYEVKFVSSSNENLMFNVYDYRLQAKDFNSPIVSWIKNVQMFFQQN